MKDSDNIFYSLGYWITGTLTLGLLMSLPIWLLWNYCLVSAVDGIHEVSWLQAWGIYILSNFLFKRTNVAKSLKNRASMQVGL
jgi:hypothetical protein